MNKYTKNSIIFKENNTPYSTTYNDIYFNAENGLQESVHVFINGNNLPQKFKQYQNFTIIETGFGTGLNMLATLHYWKKHSPKTAQLQYISIEKHLLPPATIKTALSHMSAIQQEYNSFIALYTPVQTTYNLSNNVRLNIIHAELDTGLDQIVKKADAWFLDGFTPSRNPEMWSKKLFDTMAQHTSPKATFATFTAASHIKKGLQSAGFTVQKKPGYGKKREILVGNYG